MLENVDTLHTFKYKVGCVYEEFKELSLTDKYKGLQILEKCLEEMQKLIGVHKISESIEEFIEKNEVSDDKKTSQLATNDYKLSFKCDLINPLNIFNGNDFGFQLPIQNDNDSEKDETDTFSESSRSVFQTHLNSLVERLENDDTFLNSDNSAVINYNDVVDKDDLVVIEVNAATGVNKNKIHSNNNFNININNKLINKENLNFFNFNREGATSCDFNIDNNVVNNNKISDSKKGRAVEIYTCPLCRKQFNSYISIIEHIFNHPGTPLSCVKCVNTFQNMISFNYHLNYDKCTPKSKFENEKFKKYPFEKFICCPYCGERFSKNSNLTRHIQRRCEYPKQILNKENGCQKQRKYQCKKCEKSFISRKLFREHNNIHKKTGNKYSCRVCEMTFRIRALYREHMRNFKTDEKHISMKKNLDNEDKIWCKDCVACFVNVKSYQKHLKSESHKRVNAEVISDVREFVCEKCGLAFKTRSALLGHNAKVHKKGVLKCDLCTYSTVDTYNMTRHKNVYHKKLPKKFACDKCPSLFISFSALKQHMICAHSEERPYACDICDKKFKLNYQLKKHKVLHNSLPHIPCCYCDMKFRKNRHLERHILSKHEDNIRKLYSPNEYEKLNLKKSQDKSRKDIVHSSTTEIVDTQANQEYSVVEVPSMDGGYVLLVNDVEKDNVLNITEGNDIPDLWASSVTEIYSINPSLSEPIISQVYMFPQNNEPNTPPIENPKEVISEYVPSMEILPSDYNIMKTDLLTQNNLNPEIAIPHVVFENLDNYTLSVAHHAYVGPEAGPKFGGPPV